MNDNVLSPHEDYKIFKRFKDKSVILENLDDPSKYFSLFRKYITKYPKCSSLYNEMGCFLNMRGHYLDALHYFQMSLAIDDTNIRSKQNLNNIYNLLMSGWHFPMLNDYKRNNAYAQAIRIIIAKLNPKCTLDLGCGTGILSLLCQKYNASQVYACESNPLMLEICHKVLTTSKGPYPNINLIAKGSYDIMVGQDLLGPIDLLVIELFDAGFLGEGIIPVLKDFWGRLATKQDGAPKCTVIPDRASLKIAFLECRDTLASPNRRNLKIRAGSGFGLKRMMRTSDTNNTLIKFYRINLWLGGSHYVTRLGNSMPVNYNYNLPIASTRPLKGFDQQGSREPYHSDKLLKSDRLLSPFAEITELRLSEESSINQFLPLEEGGENLIASLDLSTEKSGYCDTIVLGFNLFMLSRAHPIGGRGETGDIVISSLDPDSCWELAHYNFVNGPVYIEEGSGKYCLKVFSKGTYLIFELYQIHALADFSTSSLNKENIINVSTQHLLSPMQLEYLMDQFKVSPLSPQTNYDAREVGGTLNDYASTEAFLKALSQIILSTFKFCQVPGENALINFVDSSRAPSLAGWLLNEREGEMRLKLLQLANFPSDLYFNTTYTFYPNLLSNNGAKIYNKVFANILYFGDIIDPKGMIRSGVLEDLKSAATKLRAEPDAEVIPFAVKLFIRPIQSLALLNRTSIANEGFMKEFGIANIFNQYRASIFMDFDLNQLPHESLCSRDAEVTRFNILEITQSSSETALESRWNRIVYLDLPVCKDGQLTAFAFWFRILLVDPALNPEHEIDTLDPRNHWKQAAVILSQTTDVKEGQTLQLRIVIQDDYLDIRILNIK